MHKIITRKISINLPTGKSAFLWGPRKTGKSFWLNQQFPDSIKIDLLKSDVFAEYASRPSLIRERYSSYVDLIVIDEIQMLPELLNEIHWLIENSKLSFILTGSSPRKLYRKHANLLGGRAYRFTMEPLTFLETEGFDIESVMISGLLPPHFLANDPLSELRAYVGDYLKEEIANEARVQNMPSFAEFLRIAAITNGELLNYTNVARESGVKANTVRAYFQILEDTLLGFRLKPWKKSNLRRMIETEKFYFFDIGVANFIAKRAPKIGTPEFGKSFEHYILMELKAYKAYCEPDMEISYWRTASGYEVDFVLEDMQTVIEVKAGKVHEGDLRHIRALHEDYKTKKSLVVCFETTPRKTDDNIEILPWQVFIKQLWNGEIVS